MCRTGARLNAYDAIASYNKQMGGTLRVAAMSALEYTGFNHYVPMGKPVLMVASSLVGNYASKYTFSLFQGNFSNSFLARKNKNIYLCS